MQITITGINRLFSGFLLLFFWLDGFSQDCGTGACDVCHAQLTISNIENGTIEVGISTIRTVIEPT